MVGSKCNLKVHVRNLGSPFPIPIGGPKTTFLGGLQLKGNFNGLYLGNETWYSQSVKCVDNYKGSPTLSQNVMNFGPQTAQNSTCILPTLLKFAILLHCQGLQTEIKKHNSTKLCQVMGSKLPQQTVVEKLEPSVQQKLGAKNFCICSIFWRLRDLMANIFWTKRGTDNRKRALESTRGFRHRLKMSWTLVHKRLKIGSKFSPTLHKFCIVLPTRCTQKPNHTKRCQTGGNKWRWCKPNKVAPHSECKCNHRN